MCSFLRDKQVFSFYLKVPSICSKESITATRLGIDTSLKQFSKKSITMHYCLSTKIIIHWKCCWCIVLFGGYKITPLNHINLGTYQTEYSEKWGEYHVKDFVENVVAIQVLVIHVYGCASTGMYTFKVMLHTSSLKTHSISKSLMWLKDTVSTDMNHFDPLNYVHAENLRSIHVPAGRTI